VLVLLNVVKGRINKSVCVVFLVRDSEMQLKLVTKIFLFYHLLFLFYFLHWLKGSATRALKRIHYFFKLKIKYIKKKIKKNYLQKKILIHSMSNLLLVRERLIEIGKKYLPKAVGNN
jgi:hypothetical protein